MAEYVVVDKTQLDADLTVVADAIREKSGVEEKLELPNGFKSVVDNIPKAKEEQEKTIEITENGVTEVIPDDGKVLSKVSVNVGVGGGSNTNLSEYAVSLQNAFSEVAFESGTEIDLILGTKPNLILHGEALSSTFWQATGLKSVKIKIGQTPNVGINLQNFVRSNFNEVELEKVEFDSAYTLYIKSISSAFRQRSGLKQIIGELNIARCTSSSATSNAFINCNALEEVRFSKGTIQMSIGFAQSSNLSAESIQSIIDGLAPVETAQTLTLHADVKAKLTDEQIAQITSKNWTLA